MGVTIRTAEIEHSIYDGLCEGTPLTVLCNALGVGLSTVYDWREKDPVFAGNIARARDIGWDAIASRLRQTARGGGDSTDDVQRDKLIIETDLKLLAKWDGRRYGEKPAGDVDNPIHIVNTIRREVIDPSA